MKAIWVFLKGKYIVNQTPEVAYHNTLCHVLDYILGLHQLHHIF